jgi:hypothetical protein
LTLRGLFTKDLSWQAKQSALRSTMTFYSNCMKMCENFVPNFGDKRIGCCITTTHYLTLPFSPRNFWRYTTWLSSPTHPTRLSWPPVKFLVLPDCR